MWRSPSIPWHDCNQQQRLLLNQAYRDGTLSWKLTGSQQDSYSKLARWKATPNPKWPIYGLDISRRWGKSALLCESSLEDCFQHKSWRVVYVAPTFEMVRKIVLPLMDLLLIDCPPPLRPKWIKSEGKYEFFTGSYIDLIGLDVRPDGARGTGVDMVYLDEAGFFDNLEYLLTSVIQPQMLGRPHARIIAASTPPVTPMHYWSTDVIPTCISNDAHDRKTLDDADQYSEEEIERFYEMMPGGRNGIAARREYGAEHIADDTLMILPEFRDAEKLIVKEWEPPVWRDCYVSMDPGFHDLTAILYAYWDFYEKKLVIEDEDSAPRQNSFEVAQSVKRTELKLWKGLVRRSSGSAEGYKPQPYLRIADNNEPRLLYDLSNDHQLMFAATRKDNLSQQVDAVRVALQRQEIIINPRCKKLIAHCRNGIWKKGKIGRVFEQGGERMGGYTFGHFDFIAALIYLYRNINKGRCPEPKAQRYVAGDLRVKEAPAFRQGSRWMRRGQRFYINTGKV